MRDYHNRGGNQLSYCTAGIPICFSQKAKCASTWFKHILQFHEYRRDPPRTRRGETFDYALLYENWTPHDRGGRPCLEKELATRRIRRGRCSRCVVVKHSYYFLHKPTKNVANTRLDVVVVSLCLLGSASGWCGVRLVLEV